MNREIYIKKFIVEDEFGGIFPESKLNAEDESK